jgi:hypothetical protein
MDDTNRQLAHSTKGLNDAERDGAWTVYGEYEMVGGHVEGLGAGRVYRPLRDYPALFAEFARFEIHDDPDRQAEAALAWARRYGVLGSEYEPPLRPTTVILLPERSDLTVRSTSRQRDSVEAFVRESRIAADVLALYKAAKAPNAQSARKWPAEPGPPKKIRNREVIEGMDAYEIYRPEGGDESASGFWTEWGLAVCADITQSYVSEYCRPMMYRRDGHFERGFAFVNLLGALWLQMYWMLTATDDEVHCHNSRCPDPDFVLPSRDKHDVGRPKMYCSISCKNQAAQIRRREGRAKTRTTKPRGAPAKSADDESSAFRRVLKDARDAVIRGSSGSA